MANPVILVVDDEPAVLRAVERELRGHFGAEYTVLAADSGAGALDVDPPPRPPRDAARPPRWSTSGCPA